MPAAQLPPEHPTPAARERLHTALLAARRELNHDECGSLLEVNEQLTLAALDAHDKVQAAEIALRDVAHRADYDALTGLANRALLLASLTQALAQARRHGKALAVLFLDLDGFKGVNDSLGHAAGDQALQHAARCLTSAIREADIVGRYGGDEFVVVLPEMAHVDEAVQVADKIRVALRGPLPLGDGEVQLGASIGISLYPEHGDDADTLIACADAAMYGIKRYGLADGAPGGQRQRGAVHTDAAQAAMQALQALEARQGDMREANAQLVLAALGAQDRQADAERAVLLQKDFLGVLAHELRNPLGPIRHAAATLGRLSGGDPRLASVQAVIERQIDQIARLVNDLLDVTRAATGKLRLERSVVDMAAIARSATDACRPALDARMQTLTVDLPGTEVLKVLGDAVRLTQVLGNLLDNASKYTPIGGAIALSLLADGPDRMVLAVSDNGSGITPALLPGVFQPFVQDAHAVAFDGAGLGIGLTVVQELIEAHGGSVTAHSAGVGLGSRFVVTLPRMHGDPHQKVVE